MKIFYAFISLICFGLLNVHSKNLHPEAMGGAPLIVGGIAAKQGQFPYQLAINYMRKLYCGATLVEVNGLQVGITAAQCVTNSIIQYTASAGEFNLEETSGLEQSRDIQQIVFYPTYNNMPPYHHDIAILFFVSSFNLNENVQEIPLPDVGKVTNGNVTVSGWGRLWDAGPMANLLHYVDIPVVNNTACREAWGTTASEIIDEQLCAGDHTGAISPCNGDTGGPAISEDGYLAGIVSWGWGCGHPEYPGVFTKVSQYIDWIQTTVLQFKKNHKNN